jgi:membrane-bound lytic murein transglycosylase D
MKFIGKYILATFIAAATTVGISAKPSLLSLSDYANDSIIVYPESVETNVHQMMQNWYLENYTALDKEVDYRPDVKTSDEEIVERLRTMPTAIEMPFNSIVRNYIDMYTGKKRSLVESMLGMSLYYMPIFEEALEREGLPNELKYLPVIESALNPDAVSRAGATGLWQIMLPTARGLGLEVNALIDERRDPIRSSEAATKYLRQLYEIYNDWSLAIAAYNCGPGNINKALRRCDTEKKDFWAIYPYLPAETRGYVPCFIAANYAMTYYNKHNISPALAKRPILTDSVHVNRRIHFQQIADVLHIPVEELQILNPQYRKQEIPGDIHPCSLVLPEKQIYAYIMSEDAIAAHDAELYARRDVVEPATIADTDQSVSNGQEGEWVTKEVVKYHKVKRNETMASIAQKYGVSLRSLKRANGNTSKVKRGQTVKVVTTEKVFKAYDKPKDEQQQANSATENAENTAPATNGTQADNVVPADDNAPDNNDEEAVEDDEEEAPATVNHEPEASAAPSAPIAKSATKAAKSNEATTTTKATEHKSEVATETATEHSTEAATETAQASKVENSFKASKAKQEAEHEAAAKKATKNKSDNKTNKTKATKTHTVKAGDNLYKIAKANGLTVDELKKLNNMKSDKITPGDKLKVK